MGGGGGGGGKAEGVVIMNEICKWEEYYDWRRVLDLF